MDSNIPASSAISNYLSEYIYTYLDIDDDTSVLVLKFNERDKPDNEFKNLTSVILSRFLNTTKTTRAGSAHKHAGISVQTFLSSMFASALYFGLQVFLFTFLRNRLKYIYQAKTILHSQGARSSEKSELKSKKAKNILKSVFGWVYVVICSPIEKYRELAGLDAYFFTRFLYVLIFLFFSLSMVNLPILIPIHYLSGFTGLQGLHDLPNDFKIKTPWLDRINMSNIVLKDPEKLVFHLLLSIFVIVWFHFLLVSELRYVHETSKKVSIHPKHQSVLFIDNIPVAMQGAKSKIAEYFNAISPQSAVDIRFLPRRCKDLYKCSQRVGNTETELEKIVLEIVLEKYFFCKSSNNKSIDGNHDIVYRGFNRYWQQYCLFCNKLAFMIKTPQRCRGYARQIRWTKIRHFNGVSWPKIRENCSQFYIEERYKVLEKTTQRYNIQIKLWEEKCRALERWNDDRYILDHKDCEPQVFLNKAFITFSTPGIAHAFEKLLSGNIHEWNNTMVGINPSDIIWSNISISNATIRFIRSCLASTLSFLIIIGWVIPVAFIGLVSQIPYVASIVPLLSQVSTNSELVNDMMAGIVPVVTLVFITEFVPFIFRWFAYLKCCRTGAEVEIDTQKWFFVFLFVHIFLVVTISSGVSLVVERVLYNPVSIPTLLAHDLPKSSNFFCSFVLIRGMAYSGGNLLQLKELFFELLYYKLTIYNPHKRHKRMKNIPAFQWGSIYPIFSVLGCIGIIYSVIAPLILPLCCIAFALVLFSFKYLYIFQIDRGNTSETFGKLYPQALMQLYAGVYCMEFCMMGLFALSNSYRLCTCMVVVFGLTIIAHFRISKLYSNLRCSVLEHSSGTNDKYSGLEENLPREFKIPFADGQYDTCLWLPNDNMGISEREAISLAHKGILCDTKTCFLNTAGDIIFNFETNI